MNNPRPYYPEYLHLETLLGNQYPLSMANGKTGAHDEMLFIIIHQAYELWFKQILFELDYVMEVFGAQKINDNSEALNLARHRLNRIIRILELLIQQVGLLDTMTPLDFLEFRNLLTPASGFQSLQFREIEMRLGLQLENRNQKDYYKRTSEGGFSEKDYAFLTSQESKESLLQRINKWLERMPFFEPVFWENYSIPANDQQSSHPFWNDYRLLYEQSLTENEKNKIQDFDYVFFEQTDINPTPEQLSALRNGFSSSALRSALFIMLYRDFPVFQTSYQILDSLIEIDHLMSNWRYKHLTMVRRMIGMRVGTGNTSGAGYLEGALQKHFIYQDLSGLSTYLIERRKLPKLPPELITHLSFNMEE